MKLEIPLHILITNLDHYVDRPGGAPRISWGEAEYLAAAGHQVTAVADALNSDAPEVEYRGNICLLRYRLRDLHPADPRRASAHQAAAREVMRRHVKDAVDVVHGHVPLPYLPALDLFGRKARTVFTIHSPATMEMEITWGSATLKEKVRRFFGLPLLKRMERRCLEHSALVTALSEFTRQQITRIHGPELGGRVQVFPGWVDLQRFQVIDDRTAAKRALGWPLDVLVLFTLRRLVPRMGLDRLLRAVATLRDRGQKLHLVIGGSGPLRQELEQLASSLNLSSSVRFLGRVADADLPTMYGACDAFVLPTAGLECFGLIALEALACGRPVLATPVAAIPEVVSNFEKEWLAASADETGIANLLHAYFSGRLPQHPPAELHRRSKELYSQSTRLQEFVTAVLGSTAEAVPASPGHESLANTRQAL